MLVLTNKAAGVDCQGTNTLVFKAQREGRAFVQRGEKHVLKKLHRLQEKGKTHKETNQKKKPRFKNNWCWLLENGQSLSPLAGENTDRYAFVQGLRF